MPTRTDSLRRAALGVVAMLACASACADAPVFPAHPLDDPAAVKAAFAARIGKPVHVLRFGFGEHYADALVQNDAAPDEFDRYEAVPGQPMKDGEPQKAGGIDCKKKVAFADLDLAAGARVLKQVRAIAAANSYKTPENVELSADIFCNDFGWRGILISEANSDAMLEITFKPDGSSPSAREMRNDGWVKVDMKKLAAGSAPPPAAAPKNEPAPTRGDGRERDFTQGIEADLARVEAKVGAPLAFKHISVDKTQLSVDVISAGEQEEDLDLHRRRRRQHQALARGRHDSVRLQQAVRCRRRSAGAAAGDDRRRAGADSADGAGLGQERAHLPQRVVRGAACVYRDRG